MQTQAIKLVENNPALWKLMNESRGVTLTQEDHKDLHKYFSGNHGDRNGGHLIGYGGLISVPVVQEVSVYTKRED